MILKHAIHECVRNIVEVINMLVGVGILIANIGLRTHFPASKKLVQKYF